MVIVGSKSKKDKPGLGTEGHILSLILDYINLPRKIAIDFYRQVGECPHPLHQIPKRRIPIHHYKPINFSPITHGIMKIANITVAIKGASLRQLVLDSVQGDHLRKFSSEPCCALGVMGYDELMERGWIGVPDHLLR